MRIDARVLVALILTAAGLAALIAALGSSRSGSGPLVVQYQASQSPYVPEAPVSQSPSPPSVPCSLNGGLCYSPQPCPTRERAATALFNAWLLHTPYFAQGCAHDRATSAIFARTATPDLEYRLGGCDGLECYYRSAEATLIMSVGELEPGRFVVGVVNWGCMAPEEAATALFHAWASGATDRANICASNAAVDSLFSTGWRPQPYSLVNCSTGHPVVCNLRHTEGTVRMEIASYQVADHSGWLTLYAVRSATALR